MTARERAIVWALIAAALLPAWAFSCYKAISYAVKRSPMPDMLP